MRTEFNPKRLIPLDLHGEQQLTATKLLTLRAELNAGRILPSTPVLYTQRGSALLVFQTRHFSLYNVMQGTLDGEPWLATFCAICNAGMSFSPVIDGVRYDFYGAGFYDAMTLLADKQTGSYWDHITGECIAGTLKGAHLEYLATMTHSKAGIVALTQPAARLVVSALDAARAALDDLAEGLRTDAKPQWLPAVTDSFDADLEDTRLPRLEMGLGVWTPQQARFYRFQTLHSHNNRLFDVLNGERLLVYIDPETLTPAALFTDATTAEWRGDILMLNNGQRVENGDVIGLDDAPLTRRPLQLFQRWYGFAITFPGCAIYTAESVVSAPAHPL
ncbi:MAG: DUF3179 domain-containing (seleno)protein [Chloroflexota bacterium]|nr:DUF3179 domain-containing (seleno)protein [Chloroflexota bacterium]